MIQNRIMNHPLPHQIGPVALSELGRLVAVQAPRALDPVFRRAGGVWDPGARRWLLERRRLGPVIRTLRRVTDPLFRHARLQLD